jgi:hypothetical protein
MAGTKWEKQEVKLLYQLSKAGKTVASITVLLFVAMIVGAFIIAGMG